MTTPNGLKRTETLPAPSEKTPKGPQGALRRGLDRFKRLLAETATVIRLGAGDGNPKKIHEPKEPTPIYPPEPPEEKKYYEFPRETSLRTGTERENISSPSGSVIRNELIDKAVENGSITEEQAAKIREQYL